METKETIAAQYFHGQERFNCCQAVLKAFAHKTLMTDSFIADNFHKYGGGRAPDNMCGALYAAGILLADNQQEFLRISEQFSIQAGSASCRGIRKAGKLSCRECVELTARLLLESEADSLKARVG